MIPLFPGVDDRVQDIWRIVIERIKSYNPERGSFRSWLFTVVRNAMTDQDRAFHALGHLDDELERRLPSRETEPPTACERAEVRATVALAVEAIRSRIPKTTYRILYDHGVEGKPYEAIAADLGLSVKQVRDRYYRGETGVSSFFRRKNELTPIVSPPVRRPTSSSS